jgi:putative hemolysin
MMTKIDQIRQEATREISYASSASSVVGQKLIRLTENATGRLRLIRRAAGYETEVAQGRDFWQVMIERYGLSMDILAGGLDNIPADGPVILVANHPFGILDGLIMGHILSTRRGDFRILANTVFRKAEELNRIVLPISFDETRAAQRVNIETRRYSLNYLSKGGAIGVFPGGTVSTSRKPFSRAMDPRWRSFTARMIAKSDATVIPIYFDGANSRMFQLASRLSPTLRLSLLIREFGRRVDEPVKLVIGEPLDRAALQEFAGDPKGLMEFLRKATYTLSPTPLQSYAHGYEFEEKHKD